MLDFWILLDFFRRCNKKFLKNHVSGVCYVKLWTRALKYKQEGDQ